MSLLSVLSLPFSIQVPPARSTYFQRLSRRRMVRLRRDGARDTSRPA